MKNGSTETQNRRAGTFVNQAGGFRAFVPKPLPPNPPLDAGEKAQALLAKAERNLGRLDGLSLLVPDPDRFVHMYIRQEAVLSSQIEGTQASLADFLEYEASENEAERTVHIGEIVNYLAALKRGLALLETLPVSVRLLQEVHATLSRNAE